jgi:hypothetical protein
MENVQFQKPNTNIFAYAEMQTCGGQLVFDIEVVEFNPETDENAPISRKKLTLKEFSDWIESEKMIIV